VLVVVVVVMVMVMVMVVAAAAVRLYVITSQHHALSTTGGLSNRVTGSYLSHIAERHGRSRHDPS
jgi:hypothetical protein